MALKIYSTLSRSKEEFVPIAAGKINLYVCGMTVYDFCHLGHARVLVAFDVITRYLRASGYDVSYVRNITDIDDKILQRAAENGEPYDALTARFIAHMHEDEQQLGIARPDKEPRATAYIDDIIALIKRLEDKGYAYTADNGDVYYAVGKFEGYGKLSNKNPDELLAGARVAAEDAKRDPRDFALWKAAKPGEVHWPSPWGKGRPGWHIECSAMSTCCLGDSFDIHGGGPDLPFPHHENEIAQSEAATGKQYAKYWMHAGAVRVDGEKMSKSLGNFFTIREILEKYPAEVVRYLLIASHYRSAINYSEDSLKDARTKLDRFYHVLKDHPNVAKAEPSVLKDNSRYQQFTAAMDDDFNTPEALAVMYDLVREINGSEDPGEAKEKVAILKALAEPLGILQLAAIEYLQNTSSEHALSNETIEAMIAQREQARKDKDYAQSDKIRDSLLEQGVILEDSREGTTWRRA